MRRNVYKILVGKPEWKRSLRRPMSRYRHNIKIELGAIRLGIMD
jgi:hypothetical protein